MHSFDARLAVSESKRIGRIRTAELVLFYQPQMSADGTTVVCVEALIRHNHRSRGVLGPSEFLPKFGTLELDNLDWWVLDQACRDALRWPSISVSVNVSPLQLRNADFAGRVLALMDAIGVPPQRIELEIVETAFIENFDMATANIHALRKRGVKIALDDFGTGFSSLSYLLRMPIDKIKIDRCFVDKVDLVQSAAIVHAIIAMARALGLKVTAEGVETELQHRVLRAAGCHYMQGFLFSAALSVDGISRMLAQHVGATAAQVPQAVSMMPQNKKI
ncbi:MAG: EAL domain-containing protein [Hyphomicrobiales bacterium]